MDKFTIIYFDADGTEVERTAHNLPRAMHIGRKFGGMVYDEETHRIVANFSRHPIPSRVGAGAPRAVAANSGCLSSVLFGILLPIAAGFVLTMALNHATHGGVSLVAKETLKAAVMLLAGGK